MDQQLSGNNVIDASGLSCPLPLLKAKQALHRLADGEIVTILATDRGSVRDFHSFVELTEHELVDFCETDGIFRYAIRKGQKA